jgi:dihydrofolate synthase/folylpolyglutamate synthase
MVHIPAWPKVSLWSLEKKHNLEHMHKLLSKLGDPHKNLPRTIHIAGTNGKGSSQAFLKSVFTAAGFKVHSYTSPHLIEFNERIDLAGKLISDDHLFELLDRVKYASDSLGIQPSFFEGTTVAAFLAFAEVEADVLILETGIGGRLDPTNVIENPIATLITPISYDHMEYLGGTLAKIASEKAGIIKPGTPCVVSAQTEEVYDIIVDKCEKIGAPCFCFEYDYGVNLLSDGFEYLSQKYRLKFPLPSLHGNHQILNAAGAIATIMMVNDEFKITSRQIVDGLLSAKWPGRIQKIEPAAYSHLAGNNIRIYIDGAHNAAGAQVLADWVQTCLSEPVYMILGMTKNRNPIEFCSFFNDVIEEGRAVAVTSEPSSYVASVLAPLASRSDIPFKSSNSLEEAIKELAALNDKKAANIIITGSLFLTADFLKLLMKES